MEPLQAVKGVRNRLKPQRGLPLLGATALGLGLCLAIVLSARSAPARAYWLPPADDGPGALEGTDAAGSEPVITAPARIDLPTLEMPVGPIDRPTIQDDPEEPWAIGFVFYNGLNPVAGASATLVSRRGSLEVTTQSGPLSIYPYFTATLSAAPLQAALGDLIELRVSYAGQTNFSTFMVQEGMQEVYGWLSSTCGPTEVPGMVIGTDTSLTPECGPYILTGDVLIASSATLTLTPGTSLLLDPDRAIRADGTLWAEGATNAMITLLPHNQWENWGYVLLSGEPSRIWAARMEWGGGADVSDNATIRVDGALSSLAYVTVRHSGADGVRAYNDAVVGLSFLDISDSAGWGLYVDTNFSSLSILGCKVRRNEDGGIRVQGGAQGQLSSNVSNDNGGSGIYIRGSNTNLIVAYNTCRGNQAVQGGGIRWQSADGHILHNVVRENRTSGYQAHGGGMHIATSKTIPVRDNIILDNAGEEKGGGAYLQSARIEFEQNVIAGNMAQQGGGVYVYSAKSDSYLRVNAILRNQASEEGAGVYLKDHDAATHNNTILWNTAGEGQGAVHLHDAPYIGWNNLYGNTPQDLVNADADDALAEYCWWNTTDTGQIDARIWDFLDDSSVGWVNYAPILAQNNPIAPMAPPTGLVASSDGLSLTLRWNPTQDTPFDGYKVYYEPVTGGYPYTGTGATEGDSPIYVGNVTSYTLTGLPPATYHLAVTARDQDADGEDDQTEGHESWFSDPATAVVLGPPEANFDAAPTAGITPLTVDFTNTSDGYYQTSLWEFGDGVTSRRESPTHTYTSVGTFDVSLTISGTLGSDTLVRPALIQTYEPVSADFIASPTEGVAPLLVGFTNTSSGDYVTCTWTFGDGDASDDCNDPDHEYTTTGVYTVSLAVSGLGGSDILTRTSYITVHEGPKANFSATPTEGPAPLSVDFTNTSTGDYDTCTWTFGDGDTSHDCGDPTHIYADPGVYTVTLAISGPGGSDTETKVNYITACEPVTAGLTAAPAEGIAPLSVDFTNTSTGDYDTCTWTFGDGDTSHDCGDPTHIYADPGVYTVTLAISGPGGSDTETKVDYITAYDPVTADFTATPTQGPAPLSVDFSNTSTGEFTESLWDFGDGVTSTQESPAHIYSGPGVYTVTLTVSGPGGVDVRTRPAYIDVSAGARVYLPCVLCHLSASRSVSAATRGLPAPAPLRRATDRR